MRGESPALQGGEDVKQNLKKMRERVNTDITEVPVPKYYLVRNDSGLWHLLDPSHAGRVKHGDSTSVTTRCGTNVDVGSADELLYVTDWLTAKDVLETYTADEIFDEFKPYAGQCQSCLASHKARGATDFARLSIPDSYKPPK